MTQPAPIRWSSLPLALLILIQSLLSTPTYALSGGPTQPEFGQPSVVGSDDMVDLFTGNFRYSVPLFEIGGYPINLSYSSDHGMEEEASWVGFGWTLNPGAISRQVRGLPDDFRGDKDKIVRRGNMKDNITLGVSPGSDIEFFGAFGLSSAFNFSYNNYTGYSFSRDISPSVNVTKILTNGVSKDVFAKETAETESSSAEGGKKFLGMNVKNPYQLSQSTNAQFSLSASLNSRAGLQQASWGGAAGLYTRSGSYTPYGPTYTPTADLPRKINANTFSFKVGGKGWWPDAVQVSLRGNKVVQGLASKYLAQPAFGYMYLEGAATMDHAVMDYNKEQGGVLNLDATRLPVPYGTPDHFSVTGPGLSGQIEIVRKDFQLFRPARTKSSTVTTGMGGDISVGNIVHVGLNFDQSRTNSTKRGWTKKNCIVNPGDCDAENSDVNTEEPVPGYDPETAERKAYMRFVGDQNLRTDKKEFKDLGESNPVFADVSKAVIGTNLRLEKLVETEEKSKLNELTLPDEYRKYFFQDRERSRDATIVDYFTRAEVAVMQLDRSIHRYKLADKTLLADHVNLAELQNYQTPWLDNQNDTKSHHIGQIRITNPAGQRYNYGLPVYNISKHEITFNATDIAPDIDNRPEQGTDAYGQVEYNQNAPYLGVNNSSGKDHYYDEVITDPYPVAHLLTGVYSPDYVDVTNDGPSFDDLGSYVKIGYSPLVSAGEKTSRVGYRTPAGENKAIFNEGNRASRKYNGDDGKYSDDKASYSYGSKEVYYVHHMDSKTHRAVFLTSERNDALPVDQHGRTEVTEDGQTKPVGPRLRKLDQIKLYTLAELQRAEGDGNNMPVPIKTIHFTYATNLDSEISGNLPNAVEVSPGINRGKLTLSSVSFTYGNNERGKQNAYSFGYKTHIDEGGATPQKVLYEPFMMDRWGNQTPHHDNPNLSPIYFPYAVQDIELARRYCGLGNLTNLTLPSGGTMEIEYEPDDYAYVQDYRAGRMFTVAGFTEGYVDNYSAPNGAQRDNVLYEPKIGLGSPNLYMYIDIDEEASWATDIENWSPEEIERRFFAGVDQIYFSALVQLLRVSGSEERITGYCGFDRSTIQIAGKDDKYLAVKLKPLNIKNRETDRKSAIHPFTYAALEKLRAELPELIYGLPGDGFDMNTLVGVLSELTNSFQSYFSTRLNRLNPNAQKIDLAASFVRLSDPGFAKLGGGSRVKSIDLSDNWLPEAKDSQGNTIREAATTVYKKEYSYKTVDPISGNSISSGVAANEPMQGKEEMLYVNVGKTVYPKFMAPNPTYYMENPAGLSFFPGPSVGYSRVTMSIKVDERRFKQSKPGYTVHTFHTARDFPVKVRLSRLDRADITPKPKRFPFISVLLERHGMSQGFSIELNDMHGKPKATYEFGYPDPLIPPDKRLPISSTVYKYKTMGGENDGKAGLDNLVKMAKVEPGAEKGTATTVGIDEDYLGLDMSIWMETTDDRTNTTGGGVHGNIDLSQAFIPLAMAIPYPNINQAWTSLQTAAITKVIRRSGILEEVEVMNNGSSLATQNLRFDALTGTPVLTATENEYDQLIYQTTSPAYWMQGHEGMGPAFDRVGRVYTISTLIDGIAKGDDFEQNMLVPGDEWWAYPMDGGASTRMFVVVDTKDKPVLIDEGGKPVDLNISEEDGYRMRLLRDGRRNLLSATAEQVTALNERPTAASELYYQTTNLSATTASSILSSSAMVYSDDWGNLCEPIPPYEEPEPDPCDLCEECQPCPDCPTWEPPTCEECPEYEDCVVTSDPCDECSKCQPCPDCSTWEPPTCDECPEYEGCRPTGCSTPIKTVYPNVRVIEGSDGKCIVTPIDWRPKLTQMKGECGACEKLFNIYAQAGFMPNLNKYASCSKTENGIVTYSIRPEWKDRIAKCEFANPADGHDQYQLFAGAEVSLEVIAGSQKNPNCNKLDTPEELNGCKGLGQQPIRGSGFFALTEGVKSSEQFAVVRNGSAESCFPWHPDANVNPYLDGRRGNWRVKASYVPGQSPRRYSGIPSEAEVPLDDNGVPLNDYSQPLLHQDGVLQEYSPFWFTQGEATIPGYYIETNRVTRFDEHGHELETNDALGIVSGAQYGFNQNLPVAVAQNARHTDIGFDGFEDYVYNRGDESKQWLRHFGMLGRDIDPEGFSDRVVTDASHTGWYSYRATNASESLVQEFSVLNCDGTKVHCPNEEGCSSCVTGFRPRDLHKYLVSVWVAHRNSIRYGGLPVVSDRHDIDDDNAAKLIVYTVDEGGGAQVLAQAYPSGPVVEGWQQIQVPFQFVNSPNKIRIAIRPPNDIRGGISYFFDDVRVQPYDSEMTSYVYDNTTLRLMAQLDDRGYAVLYEYDDEGMLIRQKRETERGVMTITEQHSNLAPAPARKK